MPCFNETALSVVSQLGAIARGTQLTVVSAAAPQARVNGLGSEAAFAIRSITLTTPPRVSEPANAGRGNGRTR